MSCPRSVPKSFINKSLIHKNCNTQYKNNYTTTTCLPTNPWTWCYFHSLFSIYWSSVVSLSNRPVMLCWLVSVGPEDSHSPDLRHKCVSMKFSKSKSPKHMERFSGKKIWKRSWDSQVVKTSQPYFCSLTVKSRTKPSYKTLTTC